MTETKTASPRPRTEEWPVPSNRALTAPAQARATRAELRPLADTGNPFAADWALEDWLPSAGLEITDLRAACGTMDRLASASATEWAWHPLRDQDRGIEGWRHSYTTRGQTAGGIETVTNGRLADAVYSSPVPQTAWGMVARIAAAIPQSRFLVTHYVEREPDPFMAVTCTGHELYVIAHWGRPCRHEHVNGGICQTKRRRWWR